jgi:hypothetical protein
MLTPDADPFGVDVVLRGVGLDPADGGLAVMNLRRPLGLVTQAIADGKADIVAAGNERKQRSKTGRFVPFAPAATMNPDDYRPRLSAFVARADHVEPQRPLAGGAVLHVALVEHIPRHARPEAAPAPKSWPRPPWGRLLRQHHFARKGQG